MILRGFQQWLGTPDFEDHALDAMRRYCGGDKAILINHHTDGRPGVFMRAQFLTGQELDSYNRDYAPSYPLAKPINALPVGVAITTNSMMALREFRKFPYFGWADRSYGVYELGSVFSRAGADTIAVGIARTLAQGDFTTDQTSRLQSLVGPFRRAYLLHRRMRTTSSLDGVRVSTLIDLTDPYYGCFAINRDGTVIETNGGADDHLACGIAVVSVAGRLRFKDSSAQHILQSALTHNAQSATIPLRSLGPELLFATVLRVNDLDLPSSTTQGAHWLVFLPVLKLAHTRRKVTAFADEHSLTHMETRVLEQLVHGMDIPAIAAHLEHSIETCRSTLKHIFRKSGTRRQAELVARVLT